MQDLHADLKDVPTEELEQQITTLAAQINAATYRLLALIAELDRRQAWAGPGLRSCAHWLNWQIGIDLGAAREKVRVARALNELPKIRDAFARGTVSYSKVRAMTRVARPDNEDDLLHIALNGTASHVEKLVRLYRRAEAAGERDQAMRLWRERYFITYYNDDGALILRGKLPPEEGAVVMRALDAARAELSAMQRGAVPQTAANELDGSPAGRNDSEGASPAATASSREPIAAGRPTGATAPAVSTAPGAAADNPRLANPADDALPTFNQRNADALVHLARAGATCEVVVHIDAEALTDPDAEGTSALDDGPRVSAETSRRLACDAGIVPLVHGAAGEPLAIGRRSRKIPAAMRRALHARDQGCRFPGCTVSNRRWVDGHHIVHWANGGPTELDNLVELCQHHHRLVHEGGFRIERRADGSIRVLPPANNGPLPGCGAPRDVDDTDVAWWHELFDPMPRWKGETMDYDQAVALLQWRDARAGDGHGSAA